MKNFELVYRTRVYFQENLSESLLKEIVGYNNILLVYGQGSIKRNGLYNLIHDVLSNKKVYELPNITPNPKLSDIQRGIKIAKAESIDLILAVGGGSVIDASKAIALGAKTEDDVWEVILKQKPHNAAVDLATIPTMIATGSETNDIFVVYNDYINLKRSLKTNYVFPKFSIMNAEYTKTISKRHTVNGIVDTLSHLFEQYINKTDNYPLDNIIISLFQSMVKTGRLLITDLENEKLRSDHMFIAMYGYNGDFRSIVGGDWACHGMDYGVASLFNNFHGEGLSIITPNWLKYVIENNLMNDMLLTKVIAIFKSSFEFEIDKNLKITALNGTLAFESFLQALGAPLKFSEIDIKFTEEELEQMVEKSQFVKPLGQTINLTENDIRTIYKMGE